MTATIETELREILGAVSILGVDAFTFAGERVLVRSGYLPSVPGFPTHPLPSMPLVRDLQSVLYNRCYCRRRDADAGSSTLAPDPSFILRLSQSNHTQTRWESGWTIFAVAPSGTVSLMKGDRQRPAAAGEFFSNAPAGMPLQPGGTVTVVVPRESTVAQPGFYFAFGQTLSDVWDEDMLLRFYLHATPRSAADLVGYLTRQLNRYQVPFRLKALNDPSLYGRADAIVLYLARRYHDIVCRVVQQMPPPLADGLEPDTPLFTKVVCPGVGLAEEPRTGESFGMHRCRMTAEAIVSAWMAGDQSVDGRLRAVVNQFAASGFDLQQPHLNPGSVDIEDVERIAYA